MKPLASILLILLFSFYSFGQKDSTKYKLEVLCVTPNNLGANFNLNMEHFEHFGWNVTTAGINQTVNTCGWSVSGGNIPIEVDTLISAISDIGYWDVIAIMPANWWSGNAYGDLISDTHFLNLLNQANQQSKIIWATCAGVRVLAFADILDGVNVTGKENFASEYAAAGANYLGSNILPVIDGNIVTSTRGMYYQFQNINAIINAHSSISKHQKTKCKGTTKLMDQSTKPIEKSNTLSKGIEQITTTSDSLLTFCGYQYTEGSLADILVGQVNQVGEEIWSQTWGGDSWDYATSVSNTMDNGFLVTGFTNSNEQNNQDIFVLKYSRHGELLWQKQFGGPLPEIANSIIEASNGNIYICGQTESFGMGEDDIYLLCLNANGQLIWNKTYGGTQSDMGKEVVELSDHQLLILGNTGSFGAGNRDIYLIKTDLDGNIIWSNTYGDDGYQDASSIVELDDKSIVVVGQTDILNVDLMDMLVLKTDSAGNEIWVNTYEGNDDFYDFANDVFELNSDYLLIVGHTKYRETRHNQGIALVIEKNGTLSWQNEFQANAICSAQSICSVGNHQFLLGGYQNTSVHDFYDTWVIPFYDPITQIPKIPSSKRSAIAAYPNPFNRHIFIDYTSSNYQTINMSIFDIFGKTVKIFDGLSSVDFPIIWDGYSNNQSKINEGIYIILVEEGETCTYAKVIYQE